MCNVNSVALHSITFAFCLTTTVSLVHPNAKCGFCLLKHFALIITRVMLLSLSWLLSWKTLLAQHLLTREGVNSRWCECGHYRLTFDPEEVASTPACHPINVLTASETDCLIRHESRAVGSNPPAAFWTGTMEEISHELTLILHSCGNQNSTLVTITTFPARPRPPHGSGAL